MQIYLETEWAVCHGHVHLISFNNGAVRPSVRCLRDAALVAEIPSLAAHLLADDLDVPLSVPLLLRPLSAPPPRQVRALFPHGAQLGGDGSLGPAVLLAGPDPSHRGAAPSLPGQHRRLPRLLPPQPAVSPSEGCFPRRRCVSSVLR